MVVHGVGRGKQPSLAQLRAFAAVAEHLHFRDAAAAIGMSQPALSGAVSALEEALGVRLLERTTRKVLLSPAGERLAVRAKAVLAAVGELLEEAEAVRAPFTGVLRLGVIPTVAPYLLPAVLRLVRERYPALDLQVHEEQTSSLLEGLGAGRLDLLLLAVPLGVAGVTEIPLFDEDFVLVTPQEHWLGGRADIPREALRELPLLLLDEGHCLRDQALDICREAGRVESAPVTTTAAGLSTLVQLVAGGLGVTLLPRTALQVETGRNDRLVTGYFADPAPTRTIALAMRSGAARQGEFEEFAVALREALADLPVRVVPDGD
ncbi:LysR substrate-binding domain-containing protein [Streptomyces sp. NPDC059828]|uniref:LysR substrate-binding domain-containing protein n=1 Tax=Streptomyces sp. NPDC059828 TaxID=3346965 RepID=UPI00364827AE